MQWPRFSHAALLTVALARSFYTPTGNASIIVNKIRPDVQLRPILTSYEVECRCFGAPIRGTSLDKAIPESRHVLLHRLLSHCTLLENDTPTRSPGANQSVCKSNWRSIVCRALVSIIVIANLV